MKKFLLSTLVGTTLFSTMASGSLVFAADTQQVQVNYESIPEIATAQYMVAIPQTIKFTSANEGVDLKIELFAQDGGDYTGGNGVDISIASANEFKLKSNAKELPYSLTYENNVYNTAKHDSTITLDQNKKSIDGKAKINATNSIKPGNYADTLTYTVTAKQ